MMKGFWYNSVIEIHYVTVGIM